MQKKYDALKLGEILLKRKMTCAAAESCTGGLIGGALTSVSGSSQWFLGGIISYANSVKVNVLGVNPKDIETVGAVSEEVVRSMALGACKVIGADAAMAVSGVAGPAGGTPEKPVGTVWIAAAVQGKAHAKVFHFDGDRESIRKQTVQEAINMLCASLNTMN